MKNKNYPFYDVTPVKNLKELIEVIAEKYGDNNAITFERNNDDVHITYRRLKSDVEALSAAFFSLGIKDDKIAVIGENSYEWLLTYFAAVNSGNVIVPLDRDLPAADVLNLVNDSGTKVFVYSDSYSDMMEHLRDNGTDITHYINMDEIAGIIEKHAGKSVNIEIDDNAFAVLLYTSGTTGVAKGVMLSHYAIACDTVACCQSVKVRYNNLLVLPLHHSFGLTACVLYMLLSGSEIVINLSLKRLIQDLLKYQPYNAFLVPLFVETFYKKIWDGAKKKGKDGLLRKLIGISNFLLKIGIDVRRKLFKSVLKELGGNLELIVSGGAPIDAKYVKGLRDFGIITLNGYGITECSPVVSVNRNRYYRDGSIGLVYPCCEVRIAEPDENGHGEICVRGGNVMLGYYKNEQATKEAFDGEWFKTGDIGYLDSDGFLFISGRKKNLIILSSGKNIYPEEMEFAVLNNIPYVKEVVVFAEADTIVAEMFLDTENYPECAGVVNEDILMLNRTLPVYKNIGKTVIRETEFPKTTTKKIKRNNKNV
ncbi:MAG: AMP-binding protein [Oscillospiraceae bacterium]|nr:AMP-binding protein [Oscillospiraceae bacterium]